MFNLQWCVNMLKDRLNPDNLSSTTHRFLAFGTAGNNFGTDTNGILSGFTEVTNANGNNYRRIELTATGLGGQYILTGRTNQAQSSSTPLTTTQTVSIENSAGATIVSEEERTVALVQNTNEYIMGAYTGDDTGGNTGWGTVDAFVIFDSVTAGTAICYGKLSSPVTVGPEKVPLILKGNFQVTLG